MSDALPDPPEMDPSTLSSASFTRSRKGFEPAEVRKTLDRAADALQAWANRDDELSRRIDDLSGRLESAEHLDDARVAELLGSETARIVTAARTAAAEIRSHAEQESAKLLADTDASARATADALVSDATADRERAATARQAADEQAAGIVSRATEEADRLTSSATAQAALLTAAAAEQAESVRRDAEEAAESLRSEAHSRHDELMAAASSVYAERSAEAEAGVVPIRGAAEAELAEARREAEQLRKEALAAAGHELDRAREEGRQMVAEAKAVRHRMLRDFAERRRTVRQQLEAARVAREGVIEAIRTATVRLDDALGELDESEADIRRASDQAAVAVLDDVDRVVAEIEAELEGGVAAGADVDGPPLDDAVTDEGVIHEALVDDEAVAGEAADADLDDAAPGDAPPDDTAGSGDTAPTVVLDVGYADADVGPLVATSASVSDGRDHEAVPAGDHPTGAANRLSGPTPDARGQMASVHDLFERLRSAGPAPIAEAVPLVSASAGEAAVATEVVTALQPDPAAHEATPAVDLTTGEPAAEAGDQRLLDRRDEVVAPAERLLARNLKRLVSDEQNDVLDRARRLKRGRVELTDLLPDDAATGRFTEVLAEPYLLAAVAGAQMWCELTGASTPELTAATVDDTLTSRVGDLLELRRMHLRDVLEQIDESGEDLVVLVDHLRAAYRELRATSVPELAADLAASGFNAGTQAAAGPASSWRWVPDNGGLPCADAEDNALGGVLPCGSEFPTGDVLPPAHPGCRCILAPG